MSKTSQDKDKEEDIDLDELLDDALEDFQQKPAGRDLDSGGGGGGGARDWSREFSASRKIRDGRLGVPAASDTPDENDTPPNSFVDPNMFKESIYF